MHRLSVLRRFGINGSGASPAEKRCKGTANFADKNGKLPRKFGKIFYRARGLKFVVCGEFPIHDQWKCQTHG